MEISEGVIRWGWLTPSSISIILQKNKTWYEPCTYLLSQDSQSTLNISKALLSTISYISINIVRFAWTVHQMQFKIISATKLILRPPHNNRGPDTIAVFKADVRGLLNCLSTNQSHSLFFFPLNFKGNTVIHGVKDLPSFTRGISLASDHPVAIAIICIINTCNGLKIPIQHKSFHHLVFYMQKSVHSIFPCQCI